MTRAEQLFRILFPRRVWERQPKYIQQWFIAIAEAERCA